MKIGKKTKEINKEKEVLVLLQVFSLKILFLKVSFRHFHATVLVCVPVVWRLANY